jgi:hypothetical protein
MEALTRLVADSLSRHGFDRPVDPRRLQWSRWFRCDSPHSLLVVPSKPGIFALAEEIMGNVARAPSPATSAGSDISGGAATGILGGAALQRCDSLPGMDAALAAEVKPVKPMRARLASGRCFLRFVVIEDQAQRRSICAALNQWMLSSAEKASGIGADFQSSLELAVGRTLLSDSAVTTTAPAQASAVAVPHLDSGANKNLHCPHPLPSGF